MKANSIWIAITKVVVMVATFLGVEGLQVPDGDEGTAAMIMIVVYAGLGLFEKYVLRREAGISEPTPKR